MTKKQIIKHTSGQGNLTHLEFEDVIVECRESQVIRNKSLTVIRELRADSLFVWNLVDGNKVAFYPNEGIFYIIDEKTLKAFYNGD